MTKKIVYEAAQVYTVNRGTLTRRVLYFKDVQNNKHKTVKHSQLILDVANFALEHAISDPVWAEQVLNNLSEHVKSFVSYEESSIQELQSFANAAGLCPLSHSQALSIQLNQGLFT